MESHTYLSGKKWKEYFERDSVLARATRMRIDPEIVVRMQQQMVYYHEPIPDFLDDDLSAVRERIESCVLLKYVFVDAEKQVVNTDQVRKHSC